MADLLPTDSIKQALATEYFRRALSVALTLAVAWLVVAVVRAAVARFERRLAARRGTGVLTAEERAQRVNTVLRVAFDVIKAIVYALAVMSVLADFGVSVQPLVAGAGLAGAAIAFGSQAIVKDFVSGFFILLENHFDIGDTVVLAAGVEGVVEKMTLRVTIVRGVEGAVYIVPNGSIATVTNKTHEWADAGILITTELAADPALVRGALEAAGQAVAARDEDPQKILLGPVRVVGPLLKGKTLEWGLRVRTRPSARDIAYGWLVDEAVRRVRDDKLPLA